MSKSKLDGMEITNLVFIALALALGVASYFLFNNVSEKKQEIAAANAQTSALKSEVSSMNSDFAKLKEKLGYQDVDDVNVLDEEMRKDVEKALGKVEENSTYRDIVVALGANYQAKTAELNATYQDQLNEAMRVETSETNKTDNQQTAFADQTKVLEEGHAASIASATKSYDDLNASFKEQTGELNKLIDSTKKEIELAKQDTADFKELREKFEAENQSLSRRVDDLANATYERADAQIVYADQVLKLVRLNVGERDGVRPLTTFNVYPPNALDMNDSTSKGCVQIVRTLGEHMCEAKILEDEMSNPVQEGDLVYTPLWRPGDVIRYALDYKLDINKDRRSDLDEILTLVRGAGADVAAYIDDDGELKGVSSIDELTRDIYAVVVADEALSDVMDREFAMPAQDKERILNLQQQFMSKLNKLDVVEMPLSEFLDKIGYRPTAGVTRYREEGGVSMQENGVQRQVVSPGVTAPIYIDGADRPQVSPGVTAPTYRKGADRPEQSPGVVSGYYTRERSTKGSNK